MRLVRFFLEGRTGYGVLEGERLFPLWGPPFDGICRTGEMFLVDNVTLLAPAEPSKIVALALNYRDHAAEFGRPVPEEPLIFLKPPSAVIGPGEPIILPPMSRRVDYEAELGVVIGKPARLVPEEEALAYVLGYTCINDVTARDLQKKDGLFTRAKGFDTFAPLGPWIETDIPDPHRLQVETWVNGERRQQGNTRDLIFGVPRLIAFISRIMTLLPGDVIATGTPAGVGPLRPGDLVEVWVEGIGTLRNPVSAERD
ncbi:MAG: fumarylacetoacetate hydrolase family protein [Syntrophobacterales bacterium]|nr:fumarylacetoacetate hydrolase family protein [Syntrophobacterales bacterium]